MDVAFRVAAFDAFARIRLVEDVWRSGRCDDVTFRLQKQGRFPFRNDLVCIRLFAANDDAGRG